MPTKKSPKKKPAKKGPAKKGPAKKGPAKKGPARKAASTKMVAPAKKAWTVPPAARAAGEKRAWLVKSEPDVFSFDDLVAAPNQTTHWDGVRNYTARNFMRDAMWEGDPVLYYHSNADPPHIAGLGVVARRGYPDPSSFDPSSKYFDEGTTPDHPRWYCVDVKAVEKLKTPVSLNALKENPRLERMLVVQKGQRLSVQPVAYDELDEVLAMGGIRRKGG